MWEENKQGLHRRFEFTDFTSAFSFMTAVAFVAERMKHHPTWTNTYNVVDFTLTTHDAGNTVTQKDHLLAAAIDAAYTKMFGSA